jgi:hypothetical protein
MMKESVPVSSINEDKYEQSQKRYWEQLRQEFDRFKSELGATHSELAQCLGISRQPLVSFMQNSSLGLPIQRSNLERLWDLLTTPEYFNKKRLSNEARANREALRQKGPGTLLKAAGFLPGSSEQILDISPRLYQQIQRIVSRLSNLPLLDSTEFIRLIESIESLILSSFPSDHKIGFEKEQLPYVCMPSEEFIERWIQENYLLRQPGEIEEKFKRALSRLAASGKYELENSEMFELYMSILENERLYSDTNEFLKMRITQCQFKTLSFLFKEYTIDENIEQELNQASLNAERKLRAALCDKRYIDKHLANAVLDVVIEVSIICNFTQPNADLCWRYSSSTTHLENMFAAMSYGMGCESALELADLSIRSLGRRNYSLVKTSVVFKSINAQQVNQTSTTYQGIWVDRSAILGILQSFVMAIRGWLTEKFIEPQSCENYYRICKAVAALDENLVKGRKVLNGYRIQHTGYFGTLAADFYLEKEVINKIEELQDEFLRIDPEFLKLYGAALEHKYCIAKLSCVHSSLIEGDILKATKLLKETEAYLQNTVHENILINALFSCEKMLHSFFTGNKNLLSDCKQWRSDLDFHLTALSEYIYKVRKDCGRFDYDTYMIASEIFGRIGRLNFCLCNLEDIIYLEEAIQSFLKAAYCSSKIGHRQRAAHWISNASRVCSRLGDAGRAKGFSDLAKDIIDRVIEPAYSLEYQQALMAEINMSYGEQLLLIEKDFDGAIQYFLKSLKGSIYIGFVRLIADGLYNISRASKNLGNYRVRKSFEDAFGEEDLKNNQQIWELKEDKQGWLENRIAAEVIKFINQVDKDAVWSSVSEEFQQQAKKIWHDWANFEASGMETKHPMEDQIDNYSYLSKVG